ncbi:MAG: hypothetical protein HRU34_13330, partial [Richelia sp.]|nr:hypothetical protein [Richelia sp.]
PPVPPKGGSLRLGTKCPSLAFALDNQDMLHNYVQQSVIFTTKLDALTLLTRSAILRHFFVVRYL